MTKDDKNKLIELISDNNKDNVKLGLLLAKSNGLTINKIAKLCMKYLKHDLQHDINSKTICYFYRLDSLLLFISYHTTYKFFLPCHVVVSDAITIDYYVKMTGLVFTNYFNKKKGFKVLLEEFYKNYE